ncbi:hypothetical protein Pint_14604 [Pistacia integerrima]|uniref:Uncharacterized protein n=1 Tax=Pistacia integerrima TaxID=434235 RepID=A0ACC0Y8L5_9ROSI|nr:hypothetical protein Pint_14604 [Pistacia integerrima]
MILSSLMAPKRVMLAAFFFIFSLKFYSAKTETWVKGGYWYSRSELPGLGINSALYTHLHCAFADVNSTSYELSLLESDEKKFSTFTDTVKQKNPSVVTLLSIGGGDANYSTFSSMVSNSSFRKSFIDSSIKTARVYGFQGLDLCWGSANSSSDMYNMGTLFEEWRAAIELDAGNSSQAKLILTAAVRFQPGLDSRSFPVEAMERYLDWANVLAYDYYTPQRYNFTSAQAALYDPTSNVNTDYGIRAWISRGLSANKMVLGLPFYGYAWTLANPTENGIGAPATGPALRTGGAINYKDIRSYVLEYGADVKYNATYVVNYCTVGSTWICFDDVEVVRIKVAYAKEKKLLGYIAWEIPYDDNGMLSQAAEHQVLYIEKLIDNELNEDFYGNSRYQIPEDWPYQEARRLFKEPEVFTDEEQLDLKWTPPHEEGLITFLVNENGLESFFKPVANTSAPVKRKEPKCVLQSPKQAFKPTMFSLQACNSSMPNFTGSLRLPSLALGLKHSPPLSRGETPGNTPKETANKKSKAGGGGTKKK